MDHVLHEIFLLMCFVLDFIFFIFFFAPQHRALIFHFLCKFSHSITSKLLKNSVSTHLVQFPWQYGFATLQFYHSSASDTIHDILMGYSIFFQVSRGPLSSNDIGLHTIGILITINSLFSTWEKCNLISVCCIPNTNELY